MQGAIGRDKEIREMEEVVRKSVRCLCPPARRRTVRSHDTRAR